MARLVPAVLIIASTSLSSGALAADQSDSLWSTREKSVPSRDFNIIDDGGSSRPARVDGTRIIVGRQVMPNGVIGFGLFGQKAPPSMVAPVTFGERAVRKHRKAAVGFLLRF